MAWILLFIYTCYLRNSYIILRQAGVGLRKWEENFNLTLNKFNDPI